MHHLVVVHSSICSTHQGTWEVVLSLRIVSKLQSWLIYSIGLLMSLLIKGNREEPKAQTFKGRSPFGTPFLGRIHPRERFPNWGERFSCPSTSSFPLIRESFYPQTTANGREESLLPVSPIPTHICGWHRPSHNSKIGGGQFSTGPHWSQV